ncbi:putative zinc ribbon protein [Escherichia coli]|uniref:DUF7828 domain-containing protein n=1 Tax=Escherichia coli TaxID=562 RepID=UPI00224FB8CB|nr:putative zinc ribbon protein [Escherichia coli]MCX3187431.1 putative zinc ribbon protein [Escherichia coli]
MTIHNMQFRIIRTALNHMGKVIHTRDLTPRSRERWYCCSCNNPLRLRWTHDSGGYFEHDLEEAEELKLRQCEYQAIPQEKPVSAFEQAVNALMERDDWICPYISRHLLSLNPLQARCRRYSRGER